MNKGSLATILGAALLGLAKSKGSSARRMPLDDYFKRRVGNQKQTFKIHFWMHYAPFWARDGNSSKVVYDFDQYVGSFLDTIHDVCNGFEGYLDGNYHLYDHQYYLIEDVEAAREQAFAEQWHFDEEEWLTYIEEHEVDDLFSTWCYDNDMHWSDDLASDLMDFDSWKYLEDLRSNSEFHLKFADSIDAYKIQENIINERADELEYIIDDEDIFDYGMNDYLVGGFLQTLLKEGSFEGLEWEDKDDFDALQDQIVEKKGELKAFLNERKDDIFGAEGEWLFDWEDEIQLESGFVSGVLEVKLNLETMNVSKTNWNSFIETVLHSAYYEWYREEKPRNTIGEQEVGDPQIDKVEPDIFAKKKSNLRRR